MIPLSAETARRTREPGDLFSKLAPPRRDGRVPSDEKRALAAELLDSATEETPGQPGDTQWTPNCLVRRHNSGVERIAGISSCLGWVRKLAITQTSSRLGDIVKIAVFALANVALAIFDVVKGAFTVIKGVVTKVICCGRNAATPSAEEPATKKIADTEEPAAKKVADTEEEDEDEITTLKEKCNDGFTRHNRRLETQEAAIAHLSDKIRELAHNSSDGRLRVIEAAIARNETALSENASRLNNLNGAASNLQGRFVGLEKEVSPLRNVNTELTALNRRLDAVDDKASGNARSLSKFEGQVDLLTQRIPLHFIPMSERHSSTPVEMFPGTHSSSSSSSLLPLASSSSSSTSTMSSSSSGSSSSRMSGPTLADRMENVEIGIAELTNAIRALTTPAPAAAGSVIAAGATTVA